ncbi:MAG: hypothetical protein V8T41_03180 [Oscillospiraceae bacterium]
MSATKSIVRENLAILDKWVNDTPQVHYVKPQAGTTALVYYDLDIPSYDFCREMYHKQRRVRNSPATASSSRTASAWAMRAQSRSLSAALPR